MHSCLHWTVYYIALLMFGSVVFWADCVAGLEKYKCFVVRDPPEFLRYSSHVWNDNVFISTFHCTSVTRSCCCFDKGPDGRSNIFRNSNTFPCRTFPISVTFWNQQSDIHTHFSCCDWPGVQRWERSQGLNFSLKLSFYILDKTISLVFHVNNQVRHHAYLPGGIVWKCAALSLVTSDSSLRWLEQLLTHLISDEVGQHIIMSVAWPLQCVPDIPFQKVSHPVSCGFTDSHMTARWTSDLHVTSATINVLMTIQRLNARDSPPVSQTWGSPLDERWWNFDWAVVQLKRGFLTAFFKVLSTKIAISRRTSHKITE